MDITNSYSLEAIRLARAERMEQATPIEQLKRERHREDILKLQREHVNLFGQKTGTIINTTA